MKSGISSDLKEQHDTSSTRYYVSLIVASEKRCGGIGYRGQLPWKDAIDMKLFKDITQEGTDTSKPFDSHIGFVPSNNESKNPMQTSNFKTYNGCIMGRCTYESLEQPLSHRWNIVVTSNPVNSSHENVIFVSSLDEALKWASFRCKTTFVIGGTTLFDEVLYKQAQGSVLIEAVHWTQFDFDPVVQYYGRQDVMRSTAIAVPFLALFAMYAPLLSADWIWVLLVLLVYGLLNVVCCGDPVHYDTFISVRQWTNLTNMMERVCAEVHGRTSYWTAPHHPSGIKYTAVYQYFRGRFTTDESQYINLLTDVLCENGSNLVSPDRTGVGTVRKFGQRMEFNLKRGFPLMTTKRVPLRHVFVELMWFVRGLTDTKWLTDRGVTIWNQNVEQQAKVKLVASGTTDGRVLDYPETEAGPVYGFAWRHYNGKFDPESKTHEDAGGVDQLADLVHGLKTDPYSRRHVLLAWNPSWLRRVALPPCHMLSTFYVAPINGVNRLSCMVVMRSNDLFLGAPFNIASYALLTHMLAALCGYQVDKLVFTISDAHIYSNHINQVRQQVARTIRAAPQLRIKRIPSSIDDFEWEDFELSDYHPHATIKGDMAV